jgi:hypothetical protein
MKEKNDDKPNIYLVAMIWEDAEILQLHEFDCLMETSLQIFLNLYITVTDGSHFGGNIYAYSISTFLIFGITKIITPYFPSIFGDLSRYLHLELIMGHSLLRSKNWCSRGN